MIKAPHAALGLLLVASLGLAACSSGSSESSASASPTATSFAPLPSISASPEIEELAIDAQNACEDYYAFNLTFLAVPDMGKKRQKAAIDDLVNLATQLTGTATDAVTAQELPAKVQANAERIAKNLSRLPAKATFNDLSKKQRARIVASSARIEKACVRNGFDVPADNLAARG